MNTARQYRNGFCKYGHDINLVGRYKGGHCSVCVKNQTANKDQKKVDEYKNKCYWKRLGIKNLDNSFFTPNDYNRLFQIQGGRCANKGCDVHQSEVSMAFSVDHNHVTGYVRGLLCHNCNTGLGMLDDNLGKVKGILTYLEKSQF